MSCARDYIYYRYLVALTIKSCSALRGTGDSLHDDGSSCDRYHRKTQCCYPADRRNHQLAHHPDPLRPKGREYER